LPLLQVKAREFIAAHSYSSAPDDIRRFQQDLSLDEALTDAREAILLHLDGLLDDGQSVPKPSTHR
jgi:hypothetical protein